MIAFSWGLVSQTSITERKACFVSMYVSYISVYMWRYRGVVEGSAVYVRALSGVACQNASNPTGLDASISLN